MSQGSASGHGRGGGMGAVAILVALLFIVGPMAASTFGVAINWVSQLMLTGFGVLCLMAGMFVVTITRLYRIAPADEAFVRTGMGGKKAIIDGGAVVIRAIHSVIPVSLKTMRLEVEREGGDALITGDNLRADVKAEFYIKVQKKPEEVLMAAATLGDQAVTPENIKKVVFEKLVNALRTVAATKTLSDLHTKRNEFADAVHQIVAADLAHNGLSLETVTISKLDQTPVKAMRPDENVFDAQGARTIAEITQKAKVERNFLEREADKKVKAQDVERDKFIYERDIEVASAAAERDRQIKVAKSEAEQRSASFAAEQEKLAETARIMKEQVVQVAEVEKAKVIEVANQQREQAARTAEIDKEKAVEVTERDKQIAVANKEKDRALAEADRAAAEKDAETQKQAVLTVEVTQTAERDKTRAVITEQAEIEKKKLRNQMEADVQAYTAVKESEGEQEAAVKKAEARTKLAEAEKAAKTLEADGEQALLMVPVNVAKEQVEVERKRVEVKREDLKNQAEFESIARELQVELARIAAEKEVRKAQAEAVGVALSAAKMTIWGDPTTVTKMVESFMNGQANGQWMSGLMESTPVEVKRAAASAVGGIGMVGAQLVEHLTGKKVDPAKVEELVVGLQATAK